MLFDFALRYKTVRLVVFAVLGASLAAAATVGRVVPIGSEASDIALDESRGSLYIANFTQSRIDVMSVANNSIARSIAVAAYPGGLALSRDKRYLVVTHYAYTNGKPLAPAGANVVTIIDLNSNSKRSVTLSSAPLGVAFGREGLAAILTQTEFLTLDPATGIANVVADLPDFNSQQLPAPLPCFPPQITTGALTASADGDHIFGVAGGTCDGSSPVLLRFSYNVPQHALDVQPLSTAPTLGPRVISASSDGSYYMAGWALITCRYSETANCGPDGGPLLAQWPNSSGLLNVGSVAVRSSKNLIYAQITPAGAAPLPASSTLCYPNGNCPTYTDSGASASGTLPPALMVLDSDNLKVRKRIQIPENLAGRSVFNSDESVLYSISDSGVTVFSMAELEQKPQLMASSEDVVFRGDFCNGVAPITQSIDIVDAGGNSTPFQIAPKAGESCPAFSLSQSSGVTPATVKVTIAPPQLGSVTGTSSCILEISSPTAVNMPPPPARGAAEKDYKANVRARFRLLFNNQAPENGGAFINVPGQLADILPDPSRNRFYVLRQDKNEVQIYDSSTYKLVTTLRTSNTPTQMALTVDQRVLMVGHDDSQLALRYDLETLQMLPPIIFPIGHYPRSIAASGTGTLAVSRIVTGSSGQTGQIREDGRIDQVYAPFPGSRPALTAIPLDSLGPWDNKISASTMLIPSPSGATILGAGDDGRVLLYSASSGSFAAARRDFTSLSGAYAASNDGVYMVDHYLLNQSLVKVATVLPGADFSSGYAFAAQDGVAAAVYPTSDQHPSRNGYVQRLNMGAGSRPLPTAIVEAPALHTGDKEFPFTRTIAPIDGSAFIVLTTSGFTVLPWEFDGATAMPALDRVVNAANFTDAVAPGGLISAYGSQLSSLTLSSGAPLPTALGGSCLTVNGAPVPMLFISPTQINAQLPLQVTGPAEIVLHTPQGASDMLHVNISPVAPAIFQSGTAGPTTGIATVVRASNQVLVTNSNPVHMNDTLSIYLTGMGATSPPVPAGSPAPSDELAHTVLPATVRLGGVPLSVEFAGLAPGLAGVYQINVQVPFKAVPTGFNVPLEIVQGGISTSVPVRVVE